MSDATLVSTIANARQHALGDLPRRTAQRVPDKLAIIDGDQRITFAELEGYVDRAAAAITAAGLGKGDRLALLSHNCWQFAVLDFAAARAGVVLVPVNFMLGAEEIAFILDHSGATGFVVEDALVGTAEAAIAAAERPQITTRQVITFPGAEHPTPEGWSDLTGWLEHDGPRGEPVPMGDDDPVRMMFTSGTESRPKGPC
nr:AMP-binding protein [Nocardioides sambongensis]